MPITIIESHERLLEQAEAKLELRAIEKRSDEELKFFVAHGQWPEEKVNADNDHRESREAAGAR